MSLLLLFNQPPAAVLPLITTLSGTLVDLAGRPLVGAGLDLAVDKPARAPLVAGAGLVAGYETRLWTNAAGAFSTALVVTPQTVPAGAGLVVSLPYHQQVRVRVDSIGAFDLGELLDPAVNGTPAATCTISGSLATVGGGAVTDAVVHVGLETALVPVTTDGKLVARRPLAVPVGADGGFQLPLLRAASLLPAGVSCWIRVGHRLAGRIRVPDAASAALADLLV